MIDSKYREGQPVKVRDGEVSGHHRTPWYVKGRTGRIDAIYDPWPNPEEMAYGKTGGPRVLVYRVEFDQNDLWPKYSGPQQDKLVVDIFEHWLEPAEEANQ